MMRDHLSKIIGATVIAWHNTEDVQAVRLADGGEEVLFVDGREIHLGPDQRHAVQWVVAYCGSNKRQRRQMRQHWAAL
jgi:hypothetical protein